MELPRSVSFWTRTGPGSRHPSLAGDLETDVVIVGGGITGVTAALFLKEAGLRVVLLEAHRIAAGVTGGTTAHFTEALDTRYHVLESKFGKEGARLAARSQRVAIEHVAERVRRHGLDCRFRHLPAYLFTEPEADPSELEEEYQASLRAGLRVTMTERAPLPWETGPALRYADQATLHPREYVVALARLVPGDGCHVFEHSRVVRWKDGEPCLVETEHGRVRARAVFLATHEPLTKLFLQTKASHYRSYVLALRTRMELVDALFFDTEDPYHYIRREDDGSARYLLVGGEDHKTGQEADTRRPYQRLQRWCESRFDFEEVSDAWSSQVVEPVDGLPFVGKVPGAGHVYVATGFSGNGMTHGTMAALLVGEQLLGRKVAWAELFDARRMKVFASAGEWLRENIDYPAHLVGDRISSPQAREVGEIPAGEGRLVQVGRRKLAVYRDEQGGLTAVSPVCSHMYCHVGWNSAEKSWDCPCHGSRFTPEGEVIEGPALTGLRREELPEEFEEEGRRRRRPTEGEESTLSS